ncbi:MAG: DUF3341 domain-containing protein [Armatimonadetes bacterium]|nr:DUF3341 domain-containing protein [Armatimonadota bacterium]
MSRIETLKKAVAVLEREPQELTSSNNRGADIRAAEVARAQGKREVWGIAVEFDDTDKLIAAARAARIAGYTRMDAYTPMPVEGLSEAIGFRNKQMPALMFCGALLGGTTGYFMQWFANTQSYILNLGGRPYHTWPNFIVITFEMTILFCALTGVFGMLVLNGLPTLYHPIYNTPGFDRASQDRFFLAIESRDKKFDFDETMAFMQGLGALNVEIVEK